MREPAQPFPADPTVPPPAGSRAKLALYKAILDRIEEAFHRLASMTDQPEIVARGSYYLFRYEKQNAEAAVIQKLARMISGLHATLILIRDGYTQEVGALCRMLDEFNEDIVFLCQAIQNDEITDLHRGYLAAFSEEEFDEPDNPLLSTQSRHTIRERVSKQQSVQCLRIR